MKLGIIICPQCRSVKGVDLLLKTTKCTCCGKTIQLKKMRIQYTTESQEVLRQMIGIIRAEQDGNDVFIKNFFHGKHKKKDNKINE